MEYTGLKDAVPTTGNQIVRVCISRLWFHHGGAESGPAKSMHMVLVDSKMDHMYAIVPYPAMLGYMDKLHEDGVYDISLFSLLPPRTVLRPVEANFTMCISAATIVQRIEESIARFPTWVYCLTSFADLPTPSETPERLVDVIGKICAISDVSVFTVPGRLQPLARRDVLLSDSSGQKIKIVLWGDAAFRFNGDSWRLFGKTETAIAIFVGATVRDYSGRRGLAGCRACKWYINEDISDIAITRSRMIGQFEPVSDSPVPTGITLRLQAGQYPTKSVAELVNFNLFENEEAYFRCTVRVVGFSASHRWFTAQCETCGGSAKPNTSFPLHESYVCDQANCASTTARLMYEVAIIATDGTDEAEFILRGKEGEQLVGLPISRILAQNQTFRVNSFLGASIVKFPTSEFQTIVSARFRFLVAVREESFLKARPSFEVTAVDSNAVLPRPH